MSKKTLSRKPEDENLNLSSVAEVTPVEVVRVEKKDNTEKFVVEQIEKKGEKEVALSHDERPTPQEKAKNKAPQIPEDQIDSNKNFIYSIDAIQYRIKCANFHKNPQLAAELHKIECLLNELIHVFNHLSGEAKLVCGVAFKNGRALKC